MYSGVQHIFPVFIDNERLHFFELTYYDSEHPLFRARYVFFACRGPVMHRLLF